MFTSRQPLLAARPVPAYRGAMSASHTASTAHNTPTRETIVAVATPPGAGGVGIVRVSGPRAIAAADRLTTCTPFALAHHARMRHTTIVDHTGLPLDEGLVVCFHGPRSFTGEDVTEFHCHGSPAIVREVLAAVVEAGLARPARPGEFTRRAYLNGKLDLAQAEAVAQLASAETSEGARLARATLSGALSTRLEVLRERLLHLRTQLCVAVDFPDDEVECCPPDELVQGVEAVRADIASLIALGERTRVYREGALVVLVGAVNAGKSSLLNVLLGRERAIVTDVAGTTRDWIEERLVLGGVALRLVDTAGLRVGEGATDVVELEGIRRGRELAASADLLVLVHDASLPLGEAEAALLAETAPDHLLVVQNKLDSGTPPAWSPDAVLQTIGVSASSGAGVDALAEALAERLGAPDAVLAEARQSGAPAERHLAELRTADAELDALTTDIAAGVPYDLLGVRLEYATDALARITGLGGRISSEAVLDEVFAGFCIGK